MRAVGGIRRATRRSQGLNSAQTEPGKSRFAWGDRASKTPVVIVGASSRPQSIHCGTKDHKSTDCGRKADMMATVDLRLVRHPLQRGALVVRICLNNDFIIRIEIPP